MPNPAFSAQPQDLARRFLARLETLNHAEELRRECQKLRWISRQPHASGAAEVERWELLETIATELCQAWESVQKGIPPAQGATRVALLLLRHLAQFPHRAQESHSNNSRMLASSRRTSWSTS